MTKTIELFGDVDEHHRLTAQVPEAVPAGRIKLALIISADIPDANEEDDAGHHWFSALSREWADELADERQDIYTMADGESVDETR